MSARWALLVVLLCGACEAAPRLGTPCSLASDCPAPLVCGLGRCRAECATTRDCPRGSICLLGEGGAACALAAEDACVGPTDCPGRLACVAARCTNACATDGDCAPATRCAPEGGCVECLGDLDCALGLRCRASACLPECTVDSDCGAGARCAAGRCAPIDGDAGLPPDAGTNPIIGGDTCETAHHVVLRDGSSSIYAFHEPWTDGDPSCRSSPDGYFYVELAHESVLLADAMTGVTTLLPSGCAVVPDLQCGSDLRELVPAGRHVFVLETDDPAGEIARVDLDVSGVSVGPGAAAFPFVEPSVVARRVTLTGDGDGVCGDGPSIVFFEQADGGGALVSLDAVAVDPTIALAWSILAPDVASCRPATVGGTGVHESVGSFSVAVLSAPGATGPVEVDVTGSVGMP